MFHKENFKKPRAKRNRRHILVTQPISVGFMERRNYRCKVEKTYPDGTSTVTNVRSSGYSIEEVKEEAIRRIGHTLPLMEAGKYKLEVIDMKEIN